MRRLLLGGEVLRDPDIGAAGHPDLAGGVGLGAEVLHQVVAVALLAAAGDGINPTSAGGLAAWACASLAYSPWSSFQ